jgi:hypothetical protein
MTIIELLSVGGICAVVIAGGTFYFWYQYWHIPRVAQWTVDRLRREEAEGIPPSPRDYHYAIAFDAICFTVTDLRNEVREAFVILWAEIVCVTVFKRDFGTVDCVCMFLARIDGTGVELDEQMARWKTFIEELPQHLKACKSPSAWFSAVAFPAFETNSMDIFRRDPSEGK